MSDIIAKVRKALGRTEPSATPPVPPALPDPIIRLVHTDFGLPELFAKRAEENKIGVQWSFPEELHQKLIAFLQSHSCKRLVLPASNFLEQLGVPAALRQAGFEVALWPDVTLDAVYDFDCGITDVYAAVAETGSLVICPTPQHGRAISLIPPIHVAILQPRDFVPDLVDLMEKLSRAGQTSGTVIITGPSKTADIEMSLVVGVHGPAKVEAFLLK